MASKFYQTLYIGNGTGFTPQALSKRRKEALNLKADMLKFYKKTSDAFTERVERKLEEMVIAHKLISVDEETPLPQNIDKEKLPILTDNHQIWYSEPEIDQFLENLHQELTLGRQMQSDSCVIDPDNPDQCL